MRARSSSLSPWQAAENYLLAAKHQDTKGQEEGAVGCPLTWCGFISSSLEASIVFPSLLEIFLDRVARIVVVAGMRGLNRESVSWVRWAFRLSLGSQTLVAPHAPAIHSFEPVA